jgi:hypothetical protein
MHRRTWLAGVTTLASLRLANRQAVAAGLLSAVSTRCGYANFGFSSSTSRWIMTASAHFMPEPARDIQLVYGNFAPATGNREELGPNALTLQVELEFPDGKSVPLYFDKRKQIKIVGGTFATTDPQDMVLPAGARFFIRTTVIVDEAPFRWPQNILIRPAAGEIIVAGVDPATIEGDLQRTELHNRQQLGYGPFNILGRPERPGVAVVIIGDSVVAATGAEDQYGDRGFIERALNTQVAWCNLAIPSDSLHRFLDRSSLSRMLIDHHFTHAICALGIDDIRAGNENGIRRDFLALWNILARMGLKVFQTTITTHTTSIDKWTTGSGQTVANRNFLAGGVYHRINAWLRTVPDPLTGIFDPAALLETSLDSGIWIAPGHQAVTSDGPHLTALGVEIAAKSIDLGRLN